MINVQTQQKTTREQFEEDRRLDREFSAGGIDMEALKDRFYAARHEEFKKRIDKGDKGSLPSFNTAMLAGHTSYFGGMCVEHPDAAGRRRVYNRQCVECWKKIKAASAEMAKYRAEAQVIRQMAAKQGVAEYGGMICPDHPEAKGMRNVLTDQCVECAKVDPKPAPKTAAEHQRAYRQRLKDRSPPKEPKPPVPAKTPAQRQKEYRARKKASLT